MSTPDRPRINAKFEKGDRYVTKEGYVLKRDGVGRWFSGSATVDIPGFPNLEPVWILSDHHLDDVQLGADGCWHDPVPTNHKPVMASGVNQ